MVSCANDSRLALQNIQKKKNQEGARLSGTAAERDNYRAQSRNCCYKPIAQQRHPLGWIASDPVCAKIMKKYLSKCSKCSRALHKDIKTSLKRSWSYRNRCDVLDVTLGQLGAFCQLLVQNHEKSVQRNHDLELISSTYLEFALNCRSQMTKFLKNIQDFLNLVCAGFFEFCSQVFCVATVRYSCIA